MIYISQRPEIHYENSTPQETFNQVCVEIYE